MSEALFEWDESKALSNLEKHGVSFEEGKSVLCDPMSLTIADSDHSEIEERWIDIGMTSFGRLVTVWYTERDDRIRIIGCRNSTPREVSAYEDERIR